MYESSKVDEVSFGIFGHLLICNRGFFSNGLLRQHLLPVSRVSIPTSGPQCEGWTLGVWLTPIVDPCSEP